MAQELSVLSPRELEVLKLVAEGQTNQEIADHLVLSIKTVQEMFRTFHGFHGEGFGLILEDLLDLPTDMPVVVEGYKLLPRLVAPLLSRPDQAVWLLPTPSFRHTAFCRRGSLWSIAGRTSDPQAALANLLARDALYTEEVEKQAATLQLTRIQVNGSASADELATRVAQCLGLRRR